MADEAETLFTGIRYSSLKNQETKLSIEENQIRDQQSENGDLNLTPDNGFGSEVSSRNGKIFFSNESNGHVTSNYAHVTSNYEKHRENDIRTSYKTFSVPESETDSSPRTSDNNGDNNKDDSEQSSEQKFSFKTLTKGQKVILASTSFTNLLSYLSLSILAPFFPKEVTVFLSYIPAK